jgi:hypothetical protein
MDNRTSNSVESKYNFCICLYYEPVIKINKFSYILGSFKLKYIPLNQGQISTRSCASF